MIVLRFTKSSLFFFSFIFTSISLFNSQKVYIVNVNVEAHRFHFLAFIYLWGCMKKRQMML